MAKKNTGKSGNKKSAAKKATSKKSSTKKSTAKTVTKTGKSSGKSVISLTDSQKESVIVIQERIAKAEAQFRELSRVESNAQLAKLQILTSLQKDEAIRKDTVNNLAESYGIAISDPSQGAWNFNVEEGSFTLLESE